MDFGQIKQYFDIVLSKRLSSVDVNSGISHQHELGGFAPLRKVLGDNDIKNISARYIYLSDNITLNDDSTTAWYDARRKNPNRGPEYRLYYPSGVKSLSNCRAGDLAVVAVSSNPLRITFIFAEAESSVEAQLIWAFGLADGNRFTESHAMNNRIDAFTSDLLRRMGIQPHTPSVASNLVTDMFSRWPNSFPSGREFAEYARSTSECDSSDNPDERIVAYFNQQTILFMEYEKEDRRRRLEPLVKTTNPNYEAIDEECYSMRQRRKSAAGHAFEYHLEAIFKDNGIQFQPQAKTEDRKKPDFLFPSSKAYAAAREGCFPTDHLAMLGAKTTAKDRWRQVLNEADLIPRKHLVTLEASITVDQTTEMIDSNLQLVVPKQIQSSYTPEQQRHLWTVSDFISYISDLQHIANE